MNRCAFIGVTDIILAMPVLHTNRRGQTYYLHQGTTKGGKTTYFFSLKPQGEMATAIPEGYEIYENPDAQVFLRKQQPRLITDQELAIVENGMRKYADVKHYIIDRKKNALIVYLADQNHDPFGDMIATLLPARHKDYEKILERFLTYTAMMRFVLVDKDRRKFIAERYCFSGSIDDWISISEPEKIEKLMKKYLKHLDKDSFFELF